MRYLDLNEIQQISGACPGESCKQYTIDFLEVCSLNQMQEINKIFKSVILSEDMRNASPEMIKSALIEAVQEATF